MSKQITERYKEMSEVAHILHRPGMYVGSTKNESKHMFLYSQDDAKMVQRAEVNFIPAMLKIIDEVISNSCDEYRRTTNLGLTHIEVVMNKSGIVMVKDNGGIPVVMHDTAGCYIPEFIFGRFRTSSNYDDSEDRNWIGTNGVGSKLANVFSKSFEIFTGDGKKSFKRSWKDNMQTLNDDLAVIRCKHHFLRTIFQIDFSRFETSEQSFNADFISIIEKRCIDAAAANIGLTISFTYIDDTVETPYKVISNEWHFNTFDEYIELYSDYVDKENVISFTSEKQQIWVYPDGNINIGFVNGAECSSGTHIKSIRWDINNTISKKLLTGHNIDVSSKAIDSKYSIFCCVEVSNPSYSSQTKEELTTPANKFDKNSDSKYPLSKEFLSSIEKSEIVDLVLDWYKQKLAADDKKVTRQLNKKAKQRVRSEKFIDANSRNRSECELWLFEGDSAKSGFRIARNPQTQAAYILKGVIKNVMGMTPAQVMRHAELADLVSVVGLQWGVKNDVNKLNFSKIVIATDADHDGSKIAGLLLVFWNMFPELFEAGMIYRSMSPIITASKGDDIREYYTFKDYKKAEPKLKGFHIKYSKGLGGLSAPEYKKMMRNPIFHQFKKDDLADKSLYSWFGRGIAHERKNMLKEEV